MNKVKKDAKNQSQLDPVFVHSRREAMVILALFGVCLVWAISVYLVDGYFPAGSATEVSVIAGVPRWVFLGIVLPWCFSILCTVLFVFGYMRDDDLGETDEIEDEIKSDAENRNGAT